MPEYYKQIEGGFCDYHDYYREVAERLPNGAQIVEIGLAYGESSVFLMECLRELGKDFFLWLVDNLEYGGAAQGQAIMDHTVAAGFANQVGWNFGADRDSLTESRLFNDRELDFVFVDGNHSYPFVLADLRLWQHKVADGGIFAGHDYYLAPGVQEAVDQVFTPDQIRRVDTTKGYGVWEIDLAKVRA